jgi:hypothetical protein
LGESANDQPAASAAGGVWLSYLTDARSVLPTVSGRSDNDRTPLTKTALSSFNSKKAPFCAFRDSKSNADLPHSVNSFTIHCSET